MRMTSVTPRVTLFADRSLESGGLERNPVGADREVGNAVLAYRVRNRIHPQVRVDLHDPDLYVGNRCPRRVGDGSDERSAILRESGQTQQSRLLLK